MEHVIVGIIIMLVVLVAFMLWGKEIIPMFSKGINGFIDALKIK